MLEDWITETGRVPRTLRLDAVKSLLAARCEISVASTLPELVMCQALIHHNISFPAPSSWFPGVSTTLDGGVRLHPTHAHKIRKGRAMLFCKLDDGFSCNSSIIATADKAFNSLQIEAQGPVASVEQQSILDALYDRNQDSLLCSTLG